MSLIVRGKSALVERFILTQFYHLLSLDITSYSLHFRMSVPQFLLNVPFYTFSYWKSASKFHRTVLRRLKIEIGFLAIVRVYALCFMTQHDVFCLSRVRGLFQVCFMDFTKYPTKLHFATLLAQIPIYIDTSLGLFSLPRWNIPPDIVTGYARIFELTC